MPKEYESQDNLPLKLRMYQRFGYEDITRTDPDCAIAVMMTKERKLCDLNWINRADRRIKREFILLTRVDVKIQY
jgi:hypothetical protein